MNNTQNFLMITLLSHNKPCMLQSDFINNLEKGYDVESTKGGNNIRTITDGEKNAAFDKAIISHVQKISRDMNFFLGASLKEGYAAGLYNTYNEISNGKSHLNKGIQNYVKDKTKFPNESSFRCYFLNHKEAPKDKLDVIDIPKF